MMEVIKTEFAQILRGYFAEIKLNYVNMNGLKTVYQVAISLASEEGYIAASDDQKKVMRDQNFEEAWGHVYMFSPTRRVRFGDKKTRD